MSFYHSTRSASDSVTSKQAILAGIAPDGGLYVCDALGEKTLDVAKMCEQGYHDNARQVLGALIDDFTPNEIADVVSGAYGDNFDTPAVTPLTPLGKDWLLELYHGPTCAFKDVALQMLPRLMSVARKGDGRNIMIVTATSGDTGKAALEGFRDVDGCGITVFYPHGKVSDVQRLQMVTQKGANVAVAAVEGNFDDAQTSVKRIFADREFARELAARNTVLSSANSINVGRLVPQVTYYFDAYAQLVRAGGVALGEKIDFCVPTGNFGDVLAGYYAKLLGLPVRSFIVASNSNDVLFDFIRTGTYDRMRPFNKTISPSMDILVSSNLERLLYYLSDGDCELVASLMADLSEKGSYKVPEALLRRLQESFSCGMATDDETRAAIARTWEDEGVLIDPHTAVAKHVTDAIEHDGTPRVVLSTASPYKFPADVLAALGRDTSGMDGFECMGLLADITSTTPPEALFGLRGAAELHTDVVGLDLMRGFVDDACKRVFS